MKQCFWIRKLYNKIHIGDCIAMDGGYNLYINKFKEDSLNSGKEFSDKNFNEMLILQKEILKLNIN